MSYLSERIAASAANNSKPVGSADEAFHVKIGSIELNMLNPSDPDSSILNPNEIVWSQENKIVTHETPGQKPLTQCTIPDGLWECSIKWNALKGSDETDISDTLVKIRDLDAGPRLVKSALFPGGKCMYLQAKSITQPQGRKDYYHLVTLKFIEANDA
jgi:hypothetical protein